MIVGDDLKLFTCLFFFKHKSDATEKLEEFLASARGDGEVEVVRSDDRCEFTGQAFSRVYTRHRIKKELTSADFSRYNGTEEQTMGLIQAPLTSPSTDAAEHENLWAEPMAWAVGSLNRAAPTTKPEYTSP